MRRWRRESKKGSFSTTNPPTFFESVWRSCCRFPHRCLLRQPVILDPLPPPRVQSHLPADCSEHFFIGQKTNRVPAGRSCASKPSRFPVSSPLIKSTPVMFAPGWLRLVTIPSLTESPATKVMGMDVVTDFAARAEGAPPAATRMAGCSAVSSPANFLSWAQGSLSRRQPAAVDPH